MSDYVYLKNLNGQQIKPVTDLAAINMTTTNGIGVSTVNGGTIGIIDGYIESAYYTEMADPAVGAANVSSAYVDGGTAVAILGAYTVASAVDTAAPSQQKVPSEKAVVDALNNIVVSGVSYYAGTGIDINAGHTVSVANVPQSSVAGLETTLTGINTAVAAKQDAISAGYRMSLDGTTLNQERYFNIESPTSATITLQAGHAYKITATNSSKTLDSEQIPANQFGLEGHAEIFVAGTGLIKTTSNVVLANALEPDAVNNCRVEFRDGLCTITMENTLAGYIVTLTAGTGEGSLPYALSVSSSEYVAFDATTNGQTLDLAGATTYAGEKHVVGNGYAETAVSGGITCTSKTTFSNLTMLNVTVASGTLTLGDVFIPSGSTVSIGVGTLAIEKVTGDGGVIDLSGSTQWIKNTYEQDAFISGVTITNGDYSTTPSTHFGALNASYGNTTATDVTITNCSGGQNPVGKAQTGILTLSGCSVVNNSGELRVNSGGTLVLEGGNVFENTIGFRPGSAGAISATPKVVFKGSNTLKATITPYSEDNTGIVEITSGAIVDLTGNTNATPIAPGGGITFEAGGVTVLYGSTESPSSCTITGASITSMIGNDGSLVSDSSHFYLFGNATVTNLTFKGTRAFAVRGNYTLSNCVGSQTLAISSGCSVKISGTYSAVVQTGVNGVGTLEFADGAVVTMTNASANTAIAQAVGTVVVGNDCTINGNTITPGTYTSATIDKNGTITEA